MDQIEKILNDLYILDPSLRESEEDIRALVVSLIEVKPSVAINESFVTDLRLKLLSLSSPAKSKTHDFSWWAIRFMPLGAIAILILVFLPEMIRPDPYQISSTPAPIAPADSGETPSILSVAPESARNLILPKADPDATMGVTSIVADVGVIRGRAVIGPTCPVQIQVYPPDPECVDRPYSGPLAVTTPDGDVIILAFTPLPDGTFSIEIPEGDYTIRSAAGGNIIPRCSATAPVRVRPGSFSEVEVYCDSGIR